MGSNLAHAAEQHHHAHDSGLNVGVMDARHTPANIIKYMEDQAAPFPLLAIHTPGNKVVILHGLKWLVAPYGLTHPLNGHILAFINDVHANKGLPTLVAVNPEEFHKTKDWFPPHHATLMYTNHTQKSSLSPKATTPYCHPKSSPSQSF